MTVRIALGWMGWKDSTPVFRRVRAYPTRSKYFVVTPGVKLVTPGAFAKRRQKCRTIRGLYTLTHVPTGYCLLTNLFSIRQGKLLAMIAHNLPIDWETLKITNCKRRFRKLDNVWLAWAATFNTPDKGWAQVNAAKESKVSA